MVGEGARGGTRLELLKGLKFNESDGKVISNSYNLVITGLQVIVHSTHIFVRVNNLNCRCKKKALSFIQLNLLCDLITK